MGLSFRANGKTKRQMVPIKATAKVKLDHAISNLDGSSTVLCTISSDSIGKLNDLNGATIKGTFYSIKDSNKMFIQFSKIISKKVLIFPFLLMRYPQMDQLNSSPN